MADNPFTETARKAQAAPDRQGRNRDWWETKPMTYADWVAEDRLPKDEVDFLAIEEYVQRTGPWLQDWFERLEIAGQSCLDLGSGSGIFSTFLARHKATVTAMDLTQAGVELTRRTTRFFGVEAQVIRGDAERQPFGDDSFDFVYSWGVLHHTSNMDNALREVSRILKPGGRGMMMVYHKTSIVYYLHGMFWLIFRRKLFSGETLSSVQRFYTDGFYHRYLTKSDLGGLLRGAGLEVDAFHSTQYEKKILPVIPSWLDRALKKRFGMCLIAEFTKPRTEALGEKPL